MERWQRRADAMLQDVPGTGEAILLEPASGRIVALNALGAAVWDLLDGARDAGAIAAVLVEATGAPASTVLADVCALLSRLEAEGLVQRAEAGPEPGLLPE